MTAAPKWHLISVDDYLAGELCSPIKHEYLGGVLYAMAGARNVHNLIASNTLIAAGVRLRGKPCRPYNSDTKIRLRVDRHIRFYYPDLSIIGAPNPPQDSFQDNPAVLFEVLSRSTRRIDDGEKKDAYLTVPSLSVYLLIEQDEPAVIVWRRTEEGFVREIHAGLDAVIPLGEVGIDLPLAEIYDGVTFTPEGGEEQ